MNDETNNVVATLAATNQGETIEVQLGQELVIGRGAASDKVIQDVELSRRHAKLTFTDYELYLEDLNSQNGTFLNGKRITHNEKVKTGDVVGFSAREYRVSLPAKPRAESEGDDFIEASTRIMEAPSAWALDPKNASGSDATEFLEVDDFETNETLTVDVAEVDEPCLVVISGERQGHRFKFGTREKATTWYLGRGQNCEVVLEGDGISETHAEISNDGNKWKLTDSMSQNGTFVNGKRVLSGFLSSGDEIRIGSCSLKFFTGKATSSSAPTKAKPENKTLKIVAAALSFVVIFSIIVFVFIKLGLV